MLRVCVMLEVPVVLVDGVQMQVIVVLYQIQGLLVDPDVIEVIIFLQHHVQQEVIIEQMWVSKVVFMDMLVDIGTGLVQEQQYLLPKPKSAVLKTKCKKCKNPSPNF